MRLGLISLLNGAASLLLINNTCIFIVQSIDEREGNGTPGQHTINAAQHIQRLRLKRANGVSVDDITEDDDDDDDVKKPSAGSSRIAKTVASGSTSPKAVGGSIARSAGSTGPLFQKDDRPIPKFEPGDGVGRMRHAAMYFETAQYGKAEFLLQEAYAIFLKVSLVSGNIFSLPEILCG